MRTTPMTNHAIRSSLSLGNCPFLKYRPTVAGFARIQVALVLSEFLRIQLQVVYIQATALRSIPLAMVALAMVTGLGCSPQSSPSVSEAPAADDGEPSSAAEKPVPPTENLANGSDNAATDSATDSATEPATDEGAPKRFKIGSLDTDEARKIRATQQASLKNFLAMPLPDGLINIGKKYNVWIDKKNSRVLFDGDICLREGALELLACELGMKSHESVVQVHAQASVVHAALLAVGAKAGTPVQFRPEYKPATGDVIDIDVLWLDEDGKQHTVRAQEWVRDVETQKAMAHSWVFPGSGFWKDEFTGETSYLGDSTGDFICVSNFSTATLDVPVESSAQDAGRMYEAFTERIPPLGTKVRLILTPNKTPNLSPQREGGTDSDERPIDGEG